ncbi:MAG TPA: response regulator [Steroidobacteraceae bacterium]|jgi:FixJ family two-component response regulator|nr:response regulator [Steroidobacteraceae bacterium]
MSLDAPIVFMIDGNPSVRAALGALARAAGWQSRAAASAEEFLAWPRTTSPSCLLLELHLPGMSGLELQRRVSERTEMPIIFISGRADVPTTVAAMKAGAFEFLTKPLAPDLLLSTIESAIELSRAALRRAAEIRALQQRYESLSRREREVMNLVVSGRLNKQIGGELGISEITVKAHRGKMMRKMRACSFAELVTMAASLERDLLASRAEPYSSSTVSGRTLVSRYTHSRVTPTNQSAPTIPTATHPAGSAVNNR